MKRAFCFILNFSELRLADAAGGFYFKGKNEAGAFKIRRVAQKSGGGVCAAKAKARAQSLIFRCFCF